MKILSGFFKIANAVSIANQAVQFDNNIIMIGVDQQLYGRLNQLKFYNPEMIRKSATDSKYEINYNDEVGKGAIVIPNPKDYYMGEGV